MYNYLHAMSLQLFSKEDGVYSNPPPALHLNWTWDLFRLIEGGQSEATPVQSLVLKVLHAPTHFLRTTPLPPELVKVSLLESQSETTWNTDKPSQVRPS